MAIKERFGISIVLSCFIFIQKVDSSIINSTYSFLNENFSFWDRVLQEGTINFWAISDWSLTVIASTGWNCSILTVFACTIKLDDLVTCALIFFTALSISWDLCIWLAMLASTTFQKFLVHGTLCWHTSGSVLWWSGIVFTVFASVILNDLSGMTIHFLLWITCTIF